MTFLIGDIPFYDRYIFTDTGRIAPHYGFVLLPEKATQYQSSNLCCVITSKTPKAWGFLLLRTKYPFLDKNSYICFNRKDLVPKSGLDNKIQPRGRLSRSDLNKTFKLLKKSLYIIKDFASDKYIRGVIIYEWKKAIQGKII